MYISVRQNLASKEKGVGKTPSKSLAQDLNLYLEVSFLLHGLQVPNIHLEVLTVGSSEYSFSINLQIVLSVVSMR